MQTCQKDDFLFFLIFFWVENFKEVKIIFVTCTVDLVGQRRLTTIYILHQSLQALTFGHVLCKQKINLGSLVFKIFTKLLRRASSNFDCSSRLKSFWRFSVVSDIEKVECCKCDVESVFYSVMTVWSEKFIADTMTLTSDLVWPCLSRPHDFLFFFF